MLKLLRHKNITKTILWGLLILILPAFVLWGTGAGGKSRDGGPAFVGLIDNRKITFGDFAESLGAIRCQIVLNYYNQPKALSAFLNSKALLGKLAWDRLLMARQARKADVKASNREMVSFIRSHPIFTRNGVFDERVYYYVLKNSLGIEPRTFEEIVRSNLEVEKMNEMMTKDVTVSDDEVREFYARDNDKTKISYVIFPVDGFMGQVTVEDAQVFDYYEKNKDKFAGMVRRSMDDKAGGALPGFEELKEDIRSFIARTKAGELALKQAEDERGRIMEVMTRDALGFSQAAAKAKLNVADSAFFSIGDYVEGVGPARHIMDAAAGLKGEEISDAVLAENGAIVFVLSGSQKYDEEQFAKDKDDYSRKVLDSKKTQYIESWVGELEKANKINIEFGEYEKYYR